MKFEGFSTENRHIARAITTSADNLTKDVFIPQEQRIKSLGIGILTEPILPVYFAALIGAPAAENETNFRNSLFTLRDDMIKSPKLLIYIEKELRAPLNSELAFFDAVSREKADDTVDDFVEVITIPGDELRTNEAKKVFREFADDYIRSISPSSDELFAFGARLITWLNRCVYSDAYKASCKNDIPFLLYYGNAGKNEVTFLHFISRIGIDVLVISSDKDCIPALKDFNPEGRMQIFEFNNSQPNEPFPDKIVKSKHATVAYSAERELDTVLYGGTTFFRDFQFSDMQALTLKTTYEEIDILWHQSAKYRAGFNILNGSRAVVPNIFAKISGVRDGDIDNYWDGLRYKLSMFTRISYKAPAYNNFSASTLRAYSPYYMGKTVLIDKLKNSKFNNYSYLADYLQDLIFSKIQEAIDSGLLLLDDNEIVQLVMYVGLNFDKEILRLLQKFDFTKDVPKLIIVDVIEDTFSKIECVQLLLYNLLGFDILIYTPTGYKNIETYLSTDAFETYTMNEFKYNLRIPKFKIPTSAPEPQSDNLINKLFKKGRK